MKGVILAGGTGSRLSPITKIMNKHLLPVGPNPMIFWSIFKLKEAGIKDILILTNREHLSSFIQLLGLGEDLEVNLNYKVQEGAKGIADAVSYAKPFVKDEKFLVILGDNIFEDSLSPYIQSFKNQERGARVLLKEVGDTTRFGAALLNEKNNVISSIVEKPKSVISPYCVTGIYMYDDSVFELIDWIQVSERGELEISDVNNLYASEEQLQFDILKGWWIDAGTWQSYYQANSFIYDWLNTEKGRELQY
ncbi:spore coat protein [Anaerobacillus alkalidiazotrophicus]|uniref:Glucose-1-phosphate thymidylyltransferase n=1 Tax=Anaerobacillus alkalidiazotrophicus TaxID=472963 RepID=A0A1S2M4G3_9BACI|nr:sugar phosphate nucleotidyltransferase [Anaerobacillus alkalidiazotrophicus]OIJ18515.1 spore coat protein [Anaerobacillus alkalidiazotrophicus]OIJ19994.1 spore coat protein [Anaerobacillus alkalidiazotrophicus]